MGIRQSLLGFFGLHMLAQGFGVAPVTRTRMPTSNRSDHQPTNRGNRAPGTSEQKMCLLFVACLMTWHGDWARRTGRVKISRSSTLVGFSLRRRS